MALAVTLHHHTDRRVQGRRRAPSGGVIPQQQVSVGRRTSVNWDSHTLSLGTFGASPHAPVPGHALGPRATLWPRWARLCCAARGVSRAGHAAPSPATRPAASNGGSAVRGPAVGSGAGGLGPGPAVPRGQEVGGRPAAGLGAAGAAGCTCSTRQVVSRVWFRSMFQAGQHTKGTRRLAKPWWCKERARREEETCRMGCPRGSFKQVPMCPTTGPEVGCGARPGWRPARHATGGTPAPRLQGPRCPGATAPRR